MHHTFIKNPPFKIALVIVLIKTRVEYEVLIFVMMFSLHGNKNENLSGLSIMSLFLNM